MTGIVIVAAFGLVCGAYGYVIGQHLERGRAVERDVEQWREYRASFFSRLMAASKRMESAE